VVLDRLNDAETEPLECANAELNSALEQAVCLQNVFESNRGGIDLADIIENVFGGFTDISEPADLVDAFTNLDCPNIDFLVPTGFIPELLECFGIGVTPYIGLNFEVSMGAKFVATVGVAIDDKSNSGCFLTVCLGGGLSATLGGAVAFGAVFDDDICTLKGQSRAVDVDLFGVGFAVSVTNTCSSGDEKFFGAEFTVSVLGVGVNAGSFSQCVTLLDDSLDGGEDSLCGGGPLFLECEDDCSFDFVFG